MKMASDGQGTQETSSGCAQQKRAAEGTLDPVPSRAGDGVKKPGSIEVFLRIVSLESAGRKRVLLRTCTHSTVFCTLTYA